MAQANPWYRRALGLAPPPGGDASLPALTGAQPTTEERDIIIVHDNPIGSTGTRSFAGYSAEDYLATLRGHQRADEFDKVRRTDAQAEALLTAVKAPILGSTWEIQPGTIGDADPTDEAKADADLIRQILFEDLAFDDFIEEAATVADFGHSVFEFTDAVKQNPKLGSYNTLGALSWRSPRTIHRWNLDPANGKLVSITQYAYGDLERLVTIPAEFLLVFNIKKEGSNFEGRSLLRHCYGNYIRKNIYLKLNAIGIEKFAIPTPVATVPAGQEANPEFAKMEQVLRHYTTHQRAYIIKPAGWELELQTNPYDPQKVEVSIDNEDKRMAKGFLAAFLELGTSGHGSQSLSMDLSDFFLKSLQYVSNRIRSPINRQLIPRMIQLNRGPREVYPKLTASGIDDRASYLLAESLGIFVDKKILRPDDKLEVSMRKLYDLPPMSEEGRADRVTAPAQPFGGAPDNSNPADKLNKANPLKNPNLSLSERVRWLRSTRDH